MKLRWAWTLPVLSSLALMLAASSATAQGPYGPSPAGYPAPGMMQPPMGYGPAPGMSMYGPPGMPPGGGMAPGMMPASYQPAPDAYGNFGMVSPTQMEGAMPMDPSGMGGCPNCGGMGCDMCGGGHGHGLCNGLLGDVFGLVGPYPDGGCSAVRWFDFAVDAMFLKRDNKTPDIVIATFGVAGVNGVALSTGQLDFNDFEAGFRFTGQTQIGPASDLEFTYYGLFFWQDQAIATRLGPLPTDGIYSIFSDFGTNPPGGFAETDNANVQSIAYSSNFDNFELNFRQRWMAPNCRYQGSWLWGARYFKLDEIFTYYSQSSAGLQPGDPARTATFTADTNNSLTGLQIGGDLWVCILPGLRAGVEAKGGVYLNHMNVDNVITVNTLPIAPPTNPFVEEQIQNDVAFVGDASATITYRVNYNWTLRGGLQALFLDGVALAPSNFNTEPPAGPFGPLATTRVPFLNDNGNVFYWGFFGGVEYMW